MKISSPHYDFSDLRSKKILVVGVTGAVGREFLRILSENNIPVENLRLAASERSAGKKIEYLSHKILVEKLDENSFRNSEIALFSAGSKISRRFRDACLVQDCLLVDNSSAFRMDKDTPLVIPEVNPEAVVNHKGVIANPNCSTIIMLMAVYPIHKYFPIKRIIVSTYQSASGAGFRAMEELKSSTRAFLAQEKFIPVEFDHPYAFNLFSHNSEIDKTGYNEEERKMIKETQKILADPNILVSPTCIRVPVLRAHSESINLEFSEKVPEIDEVLECIASFPGVNLVNDAKKNYFPMPLEASEKYECLVGRVRKDISMPDKGIELFVSGDQLLKGAALNAIQIAALAVDI